VELRQVPQDVESRGLGPPQIQGLRTTACRCCCCWLTLLPLVAPAAAGGPCSCCRLTLLPRLSGRGVERCGAKTGSLSLMVYESV